MSKNSGEDRYYQSGQYDPDSRRTIVWREIIRFLAPYLNKDSTVVDLGAGYCDFINQVTANKKYAVDYSPDLKNFANPDVELINAPAWDLTKVTSDSVDVIHASNLFEHFTDEELAKTMAEGRRVLKPGGRIILMQPNFALQPKRYFDDYTHKKIFNDLSLESFLVANGFKVVFKKARFLPQEMKDSSSLLPNFLLPWLVRLYIHSPFKPFAGQMLMVGEKK